MAMLEAQATGKADYGEQAAKKTGIQLSDAYWGYIIRSNTPSNRRASVVEVLCLFFSVMLILSAVGQWMLPGAENSADVMAIKAGASLVFVLLGGVLMWYAQRGLATEVQIDTLNSEVREVTRNRRGVARPQSAMDFEDVGSAFVYRSRSRLSPSRLFLRYLDTDTLVEVASGRDDEMDILLDRISADIVAAPSRGTIAEAHRRA